MISATLAYLPVWWKILKWGLFCLILGYVCYKLHDLGHFFVEQKAYFAEKIWTKTGGCWWLAVGLCGFNWLFEALKWKEATRHWTTLSLWKALRSVVMGQALNLIVPASMGHVAGRLASLEDMSLQDSWRGGAAVLVCQSMQMTVTFFGFLIGWAYWQNHVRPIEIAWVYIGGAVFLGGAAYGLATWLRPFWWEKIQKGCAEITSVSLFKMALFSLLRYAVFTAQFVLVLYFLGVKNAWTELAAAISLVYMAKSLMPTFHFMSDLGIREFCALLFLPTIGVPEKWVIAASLWVWTINILMPSLFGACWIVKLKTMMGWRQ